MAGRFFCRLMQTPRCEAHGGDMTKYVGAIDQGTTSSRFIVFDRAGNTVASAQREHRQIYPQPGWVEHDPIETSRQHPRGDRAGVARGRPVAA